MNEHRRTLKRYESLGDIRFITCSCYRRLQLFNNDRIKIAFVDYLSETQERLSFKLYAWVLMPEHFHFLLKPVEGQQVSQILRGIKSGFAKTTIQRWRKLDAPILNRITDASGRARFWQTGGGYDRNLYSENEIVEKIAYMHTNPVRRELVKQPVEWSWSSARYFEQDKRYLGPKICELV